jgi:hypothetical protein
MAVFEGEEGDEPVAFDSGAVGSTGDGAVVGDDLGEVGESDVILGVGC